jgi:hypothetical protein
VPPRGGAGWSRKGSEAVERVESRASVRGEAPPGSEGCKVLWVVALPSCGWVRCVQAARSGRVREPEVWEVVLWRGRTARRVSASGRGEIPARLERTRRGSKASKSTKLAERNGSAV